MAGLQDLLDKYVYGDRTKQKIKDRKDENRESYGIGKADPRKQGPAFAPDSSQNRNKNVSPIVDTEKAISRGFVNPIVEIGELIGLAEEGSSKNVGLKSIAERDYSGLSDQERLALVRTKYKKDTSPIIGVKKGYEGVGGFTEDPRGQSDIGGVDAARYRNNILFNDILLGEYLDPKDGSVKYTDTAVRDQFAKMVKEDSFAYGAGLGGMYAIDLSPVGLIGAAKLVAKVPGAIKTALTSSYGKAATQLTAALTIAEASTTDAEGASKGKLIKEGIEYLTNTGKVVSVTNKKGIDIVKQTLKQIEKNKLKSTSQPTVENPNKELQAIFDGMDSRINPSSKYKKKENLNKEIVTFKYNNPLYTGKEIAKHFANLYGNKGPSHGTVGKLLDETGLSSGTTGIKNSSKIFANELKIAYAKYFEQTGQIPRTDELAAFMGVKTKRIYSLREAVKNNNSNLLENFPFKIGTYTQGGTFDRTTNAAKKLKLRSEFYADPNISTEIKDVRRRIEKTLKKWNAAFPNAQKQLDHIDGFINSQIRGTKYESLENWQILDKKLNGYKAALYENPKNGLNAIKDKIKTATGPEKIKLEAKYEAMLETYKEILADSEVIMRFDGLDGIPQAFIDANKIARSSNTVEDLTKQLNDMQKALDDNAESISKFKNIEETFTTGMKNRYGRNEGGRVPGRAHYAEMTPDGVQVHHSFLSSDRDNTKPVINPLRMFADNNAPYNPELIPGTAEYAVAQVLGSGDTERDLKERRRKRDEAREEQDVIEESRDFLSSKKPLEFHFTELLDPRKVMDNPLIRRGINGNIYGAGTYLMELAETIVNGSVDPQQVALGFGGKKDQSIPAQEGRIQFEEYFPYLHKAYEMSTQALPETPTEQTYISVIDELNRGMDRGLINLSYDIFDLAFAGLDGASGALGKDSDFAGALKKSFDNMDKTDPESWVGKISAIGTEFGVPGGTIFKLVNRFRKILGGAAGTNLFAQQTWNLKGGQKAGAVISNIIKRSGTGAVTFGINDFVVGSQYNSMNEYFGDNPLLFDEKLGYEPEDISDLTGRDLLMANFRNRLRFAADGAIIGGLFPLVGPAFKYGINPAARYVGAPVVGAGARVVGAGMTVGSKILATDKYITPNLVKLGTKGASLLGKDIISRLGAASASVFSGQNMAGQWGNFTKVLRAPLPKMEDWGMFKVTSSNPLEVGLKRFDKFLGFFRDRGNQTINNFYLTKRTEQFITGKSKEIEKLLKSIEVKSYDLANGFLKTNNKNITSPQGELYFMEQVSSYLKGQIPISKLPLELQSMAKNLSDEFDTIRKSFKDVLPEGELKTFLDTNLKEYMRHSFAAFSNPKYKIIDDIDNVAMMGERSESTLAAALGKKGLSGTKAEVDAAFASISKKDLYQNALQYITKQIQNNPEMLAAAMKRPGGLLAHAKHHLKEIIAKTKIENRDPIEIMQNIARENLGLPELIVRTGDELPQVIKKFLGQQQGLRDSVVTTTASLLTQSANMRMYNKMLDDGLKNKWIFRTREEARAAGIIDPQRIASGTDGRMAGLTGEFNPKIAEHFASPEIATSIGKAEGGMFDDLYQNVFIQGLIGYKAGVQTMKTVFSPSTQARNFLSAGFFPLNMGHIGGKSSVTDAFKMTMDDIFGAGRTMDEEGLIKNISRKVELGVLDENIVVSELQAVLRDIKSGKLKSLSGLSEKINATALSDTATKLYAGGDNVWKWYGHEYVKSQLRDVGFKNVDEALAYAKRMFNVDMGKINPMTGANKNMFDVIEEIAAYTVRETYPTYSKVPELVKVFRRIPFVGNFVSFPAEILRTSMATTAYGLKHVMDDNPLLRQIGYRTLMGQTMALGGVATAVKGIGEAYTGISGEKMDNWKKNFAPEFMRNSYIIPIGKIPRVNSVGQKIKDKDGNIKYKDDQFRVFDMSRFAPYDLITSSVSNIMNRFTGPKKERLDPRVAEGEVMREFFTTAGPLYDLAGGTFFGTAIGFEPIIPLISSGRDKNGVSVFKDTDEFSTKVDKFMAHWFKTVKPGGVASAQKVFDAIQGDVQKGSGVPINLGSELFKLFGGSDVKIDMNSAFRYKIADFKSSFIDTKESRYITTGDFRSAGPDYLLAQYNQMNKEAFNEQYQFYKAVRAARGRNNMEEKRIKAAELALIPLEQRDKKYINIDGTAKNELQILSVIIRDSRLLSDDAIEDLLRQRLGKSAAKDILKGEFKPVSTGIGEGRKDGALDTRMKNIYRNNPGIERYFPESYFLPKSLEEAKKTWSKRKFEDYEEGSDFIERRGDRDRFLNPSEKGMTETQTKPETETPPVQVADSGEAIPANLSSSNGVVNQTSGLTSTEEALLSPSEQLIRKTQRGIA